MATLFFKRSSWYWQRLPGAAAAEGKDKKGERNFHENGEDGPRNDGERSFHENENGENGPGNDRERNLHENGENGPGNDGERKFHENGENGPGNGEERTRQQRSLKIERRSYVRHGIVVLLAWMFSESRHLASFIRLYNSLGWDCLACHPHPLSLHFPGLASQLAMNILLELLKDLENHPSPVIFVMFSGGHKTCFYKIVQILLGQCREVNKGKFKVVEESIAGLIFDSSPVDFVSSIGAKVLSQQVFTLKPGQSMPVVSNAINALARGMDFAFFKPLTIQKQELWHALYSTVNIGPMLVLCSEEDELAPIETIHIFSANVRRLGGKIDVVAWKDSSHVGHFRHDPDRYKSEVKSLLMRALLAYSNRIERGSVTWTELPATVTAEIDRISAMPHLHVKNESITETGSPMVSEDIDLVVSEDIDPPGVKPGEFYGLQSRL